MATKDNSKKKKAALFGSKNDPGLGMYRGAAQKRPALFGSAGDPGLGVYRGATQKPTVRNNPAPQKAPAFGSAKDPGLGFGAGLKPGGLSTVPNPFSGVGDFLGGLRMPDWAVPTRADKFGKLFGGLGKGLYGSRNNDIVGGSHKMTDFPSGGGRKLNMGKNMNRAGDSTDLFGGGLDEPRSFADILAEVQAMMQSMGGAGGVSYDPLRNQARAQWSDADARTLAMANQLQDSIRGEAAGLNTAYDKGIADTNAATQFANTQNAQSAQNIGSMVNQQAGALGIQEAVANDLNAGNLSGQDQMARTADTTARGQITSNQLIGNRTSALDFNNDLVGSAGLSGQQMRMQRQNELNRLLAQYDVDEQEANASVQGAFKDQTFDLAKMLFGQDRDDYQFEVGTQGKAQSEANEMTRFLAGLTQKGGTSASKAPLLPQNRAITQALADMGLDEPPTRASDREDFMRLVRGYQGYKF